MNERKFTSTQAISNSLFSTLFLISLLTLSIQSCKKNTAGTGNGNGNGPGLLLSGYTLVGTNASNNVVESATNLITYDGNNNITETQFVDTSFQLEMTIIVNTITKFTYGPSFIGSATESITTQNTVVGQAPYGVTDSSYLTFYAGTSQVDSFVTSSIINTTGPLVGPTTLTMDSALLTYDANGEVSSYTVYQIEKLPGPYTLFYKQTFTYNGSNLAGYVLTNYPASSVTTATYSYNSHNAAAPFYSIIPGILLKTANDLSEISETQTGVNAGHTTYSYSSSYNSTDQPVVSTVLISMTPTNALFPVSETITYSYK
jgi:hypothetical protein